MSHDATPTDRTTAEGDARRRRIRTRVQAFVSACAVMLVAVPAALEILEQAVTPQVYAVLATGALAVTTGATLVVRIMSLPVVASWIDRYASWLSADPEA
jgi:hypothetical protein